MKNTYPLKLLAAAVAAALALAACGDNDSDRKASRSGGDAVPNSGSNASANNPTQSSGVTSGTNPTATGQSGATMSGNIASNASPGSPAGGTASTMPAPTGSPSVNAPAAAQTRADSTPTTGSSPAAGGTGTSASAAAATGAATSGAASGAASAATPAATAKGRDVSKDAVGTTETRFMTNAASSGMLEVEASRVVVQQAGSAQVRQLAERLVRDHEAANAELAQLAAAKNVQIPSEMSREDRATVDKMRKMQGRELDRAYVEQVGSAHHRKDIAEFERAARESNDPDVRAFAQKQLPILRQHHEMAQQAASQLTGTAR